MKVNFQSCGEIESTHEFEFDKGGACCMDGHWVVFFIMQLIYTIPIIAAIVGAIALPIAGLVLRKSKPQLSKKLLIIGGLCFCVVCLIFLISIFGAIFSGTLSI